MDCIKDREKAFMSAEVPHVCWLTSDPSFLQSLVIYQTTVFLSEYVFDAHWKHVLGVTTTDSTDRFIRGQICPASTIPASTMMSARHIHLLLK